MTQGDLEIQHKGTDKIWADVNTKPTQGKIFRVMRGEVMGVSAEYDNNVERRHTHPPYMPKIESEWILAADGDILEKFTIVVPARSPTKKSKNGIMRGDRSKSILSRVKPTAKRRSVLADNKYAPGSESKWKHVSARFPALFKALLAETDAATRSAMLRSAVRASG